MRIPHNGCSKKSAAPFQLEYHILLKVWVQALRWPQNQAKGLTCAAASHLPIMDVAPDPPPPHSIHRPVPTASLPFVFRGVRQRRDTSARGIAPELLLTGFPRCVCRGAVMMDVGSEPPTSCDGEARAGSTGRPQQPFAPRAGVTPVLPRATQLPLPARC